MAGSAFKQECPSCEAQVTIRDPALIGKKVKCPTCKYAFVVSKPASMPEAAAKPDAAPKPAAKKPAGKPAAASAAAPAAAPPAATASRKKLYLGLGLGVVGLAVLGIASISMMGNPKPINNPIKWTPPPGDSKDPDDVDDDGNPKKGPPKVDPDKKGPPKVVVPDKSTEPVIPPTFELTNLIPGDADHVFHGYFTNIFAFTGMMRTIVFGEPGTFAEAPLKERLGFSPLAVDDLIRAEKFGDQGWVYVVVHLNEHIDPKALALALDLKKQPAIGKHVFWKAEKRSPLLQQFDRLAIGAPSLARALVPFDDRPVAVHVYDSQTIVFADEAPLKEFLRNDRRFPAQSAAVAEGPVAANDPLNLSGTIWEGTESRAGGTKLKLTFREGGGVVRESASGSSEGSFEVANTKVSLEFGATRYDGSIAGTTLTGKGQEETNVWNITLSRTGRVPMAKAKDAGTLATGAYSTIDPSLKTVLDRIEKSDGGDRLLYSTATRAAAALLTKVPIEYKNIPIWRPRQVWDVTALYDESKPGRLRTVGSGLFEHGARGYRYRSLLECVKDSDAREVLKLAHDRFGPEVARWIDRLLRQKIELTAPEDGKDASYWSATLRDREVDVSVHLNLDKNAYERLKGLCALLSMQAKDEIDFAIDTNLRHELGRGVKALGEGGLADRNVDKGSFPPGSFRRAGAGRSADGPYYRMSWMTSLLPFLGQEGLFRRLDAEVSWRDPVNWLPAQTLVPQFQDPTYPATARNVSVPGIGVELSATHFVGIAGVGLDAAEYDRNDIATAAKRGILGYEKSATLAELGRGRGAANTILMVQVPHDGLTGVSPWIAGGGSTLRGVPEENWIKPFVLTTDRTGKAITYKGKTGTYAVMADGSIRFIDSTISDKVFKAMCTVQGNAPTEDLFADAPLVPDPTVKAAPPPVPPKTAPPKAANAEKK